MPLQPQPVPVKLTGLSGHIDSKTAQAGRIELLENGYAVKGTDGGIEVRKRNGLSLLSTSIAGGGTISAGAKVATLGSELVMTNGGKLYSWDAVASKWVLRDRVTSVSAQRRMIEGNNPNTFVGSTQFDCDAAYCNGYVIWATSIDTGQFRYYVQDWTSGEIVYAATLDGDRARVNVIGSKVFLSYSGVVGVSGVLCRTMTPGTTDPPAFGSATEIAAAAKFSAWPVIFDTTVDTTNSRLLICAWDENNTRTFLASYSSSLVLVDTSNYATESPNRAIGWMHHAWNDGSAYLALSSSTTGVRAIRVTISGMAVSNNTAADAGVTTSRHVTGFFDGTNYNVWYTVPDTTNTQDSKIKGFNGTSAADIQLSMRLTGKVFKVGTKYYATAAYQTTAQRHLYLLEYEANATQAQGMRVAGHLKVGDGAGFPKANTYLCAAAQVSATEYAVPCVGLSGPATGVFAYGSSRFTLESCKLVFDDTNLGEPVQFNGVLNIPGAAGVAYDGQNITEHGFLLVPEKPRTLTASNSTGTLTSSSTYQYCVVYNRMDANGKLWRSAVSAINTVAMGATDDTVALVIDTLRITRCSTFVGTNAKIGIEIYRTLANGSVFHLLTTLDTNSASTNTVNYTDTTPDSMLAANEILYTGAELDNVSPPCPLVYRAHKNRLFAVSGDRSVWHSKETVEGLGTGFMDATRITFDEAAGALVGAVSLDSSLVIATRSRLFVVSGDGPSPNGENPYGYPAPLPAEVGFAGPRAFCSTNDGVPFKSAKGWYLIDRAGGVQPIPGADAYDSLTIVGGVTMDDLAFACFLTSTGVILVWDWELKQWYAWTSTIVTTGAAITRWQNRLTLLDTVGDVFYVNSASYTDSGSSITMKVRLSWLQLANILGFQRVWEVQLLAEYMASHTITMRLAYDFDSTVAESPTLAVTTSTKGAIGRKPARQECTALQLTVEETSTTEGFRLSGFVLEVGVEPRGMKPLASTQHMT